MVEPDRAHGGFLLPVGTVTLLLADIEGSTRLWEHEPDAMTEAIARLDDVVGEAVGRHGGVRPVEQGEGDSFVAAFARASDAVAAAVDLQLEDLSPVHLRIGIHTGEVQLRDKGNYVGPAINRCARLRDLAHGGQTVLSGATHDLVLDQLAPGVWVEDLGTHRLRDLARPERVVQLCHERLSSDFPPLRSLDSFSHNLPVQLTTFIGRQAEVAELTGLLADHRMVTLTGAGGCGKTRLALQVAAEMLGSYPNGVWFAELAPITDPELVATTVLRALGLREEPFRTAAETITHHAATWSALLVLDNCEHLIEATASIADSLLRGCPGVTVLATSREPLGTAGEVIWQVPSLSLPDSENQVHAIGGLARSEAVLLFVERAALALPNYALTNDDAAAVAEICRRLDGIPLAIELAAARVRVLSPERIASSLNDRFRLLTGGVRTAMPRQQTLLASVDWSHDLLTQPERVVFRRLATFPGSFDLDAAEVVAAGGGIERHHVLDQLASLVDKSLVLVDDSVSYPRYRLLETVRHYALENLRESGDHDRAHERHRDHFLGVASARQDFADLERPGEQANHLLQELDNLRAAFLWSRQNDDLEPAASLAVVLTNVAMHHGRIAELRGWSDSLTTHMDELPAELRVRANLAAAAVSGTTFDPAAVVLCERAVDLAREVGDRRLLSHALFRLGITLTDLREDAEPVLVECVGLAREIDHRFVRGPSLAALGNALMWSDGARALECGEEAVQVAQGRWPNNYASFALGWTRLTQGDLGLARDLLEVVLLDARDSGDRLMMILALGLRSLALAMLGEIEAAGTSADESVAVANDIGIPIWSILGRCARGWVAVASGEVDGISEHLAEGEAFAAVLPGYGSAYLATWAEVDLTGGNVDDARERADLALAKSTAPQLAWCHAAALLARARVAVADDEPEEAEELLLRALPIWRDTLGRAFLVPTLELLARLVTDQESDEEAARLLGAADSLARRTGRARFMVDQDDHDSCVSSLHETMGAERFARAFGEGAALSFDEVIAYALRGRGERKRPSLGWASLTPTEIDVARLVAEGLPNKEIAARLFVSPRTVQSHLTHIYRKLDVSSRVQLAREAERRL